MARLVDQFGREIPAAAKLRPETRALYVPSARDRWDTYPSRGLTPARLAKILREADDGQPERQVELFREIEEKDAHLSSQLQMRKQAVLGVEYDLQPDGDDAKAQKVCDFCREALWALEDLDDLLLVLLDAVPQGWAHAELHWEIAGGRAIVAGWTEIPQERTRWDERGVPRLATDDHQSDGIEIPAWKVTYHRHKARTGRAARAGVMRTCAWWYLFKNFSIKDWAAFAEVFGMPLRIGTYPNGAKEEDKESLRQALYSLGSDGAAIVSEGTKITFEEAKASGAGQAVFERLAAYCDRAMSKAVLGQTLTSDQGQVGSYGAAKVHDEVRLDLRDADAYALEKTLRQQVLQPLVLFNFGPAAPIPWFRFALGQPEDLEAKGKVYTALKSLGLRIGAGHVYDAFGVPQPEPGEEVLGGEAAAPEAPAPAPTKAVRKSLGDDEDGQVIAAAEALATLGDRALAQAAPALDDLARAALPAVSDYQALLDQGPRAALARPLDRLAEPLFRAALAAGLNGRLAVLAEAGLAGSGVPRASRRGVAKAAGVSFLAEPLEPSEALDFFGRRAPVSPEVFAALSEDARQMAFTVAGVTREDLLTELYRAVDAGIRNGTTFEDFLATANQRFAALGLAGPQPWRLETVFRNQTQAAYAAGRYKQMAELAGQRPYWRYSAVMDSNTRPAHAAQHGKVYAVGHPFWSRWYPPNGHNCRCDVMSLSADEVRTRGYQVLTQGVDESPDTGWGYNVGEAGWGRGLVESALGAPRPATGWRFRPELVPIPDRPGAMPAPTPVGGLPRHPRALLDELGSEEAVREAYRREALEALGLEPNPSGYIPDLPLTDARGDGVVLAGRTLIHVLERPDNLGRSRYLTVARRVIEEADEIWLVPGATPEGRIGLRRRYLKSLSSPGVTDAVQVMAEFQRGVWEGFNVLPLTEQRAMQRREGILLFRRSL